MYGSAFLAGQGVAAVGNLPGVALSSWRKAVPGRDPW